MCHPKCCGKVFENESDIYVEPADRRSYCMCHLKSCGKVSKMMLLYDISRQKGYQQKQIESRDKVMFIILRLMANDRLSFVHMCQGSDLLICKHGIST